MPPKVDVSILIAKRDSTIVALYELLEEFQVLYNVQPVLSTLENVYKEMEIKYRSVKKQQEAITDRLIETGSTEEQLKANQQVGDKVRSDFLKYSEIFATYQKACNSQEPALKHDALEAMTTAVTKMADVLGSQKTASHGLEKLSVPTWDGNRKSYATWKSEFNYWMYKYKQDEDEQLEKWSQGPQFLRKPQEEWPKFEENALKINEELSAEMKPPIEARPTSCDKSEFSTSQKELRDNPLFEHLMKTCSTFSKARKTLAYVLRFVNNTRMKTKNRDPISPKELTESELRLFKWCQQTIDVDKLDKKLIPSKDEHGLLRAHGRLENIRTLPDEMRNPIILPKCHRLVELLLFHLHGKRAHCGYKSLIYESRKRFWIVGVRHMAKHLTGKCVTCKKLRKKPLMGQIPKLRVAAGFPAFSNTAIDMFGPLKVRLGRKTLKEAQVIIFTCMTTRAVHLELVTDRSTDTFLMAFRRFVSLRGNPNNCWSDCGTNFIGAQHCLKELLNDWDMPRIQSVVSEEFSSTFQWSWNVPRARTELWRVSSNQYDKRWMLHPKTKPLQKSSGERI